MTTHRIIHLRVHDPETGQPTPARVRVVGPDGRYLAPLGRLAAFHTEPYRHVGGNLRLGEKQYAYMSGACEIRVPVGRLSVEVSKGPEYEPLQQDIQLSTGQLAVRLGFPRRWDRGRQGWYAGDGRAHALSPHAALLEGAAEGLTVVNLLATEYRAANGAVSIANIDAFSGQHAALERPGHLVVVNTLNRHLQQGELALLHCHRAVYPLTLGASPDFENWSLADWCDQCHRKGGLVVWVDSEAYGGPPESLLPGKIDAIEVCRLDGAACPPAILRWYRLLDSGLRLPLVGSSGKDSNAIALGAVRTYARLQPDAEFSYRAWIEAVRAGRTFITSGPLLRFTVNGQDPGAVVEAGELLEVRAEATGWHVIDRLQLLVHGTVVAEATGPTTPIVATAEVQAERAGWITSRCWGRGRDGEWSFAHSSPVYVQAP